MIDKCLYTKIYVFINLNYEGPLRGCHTPCYGENNLLFKKKIIS